MQTGLVPTLQSTAGTGATVTLTQPYIDNNYAVHLGSLNVYDGAKASGGSIKEKTSSTFFINVFNVNADNTFQTYWKTEGYIK